MQNFYLETQDCSQENPRASNALTLGTREALGEAGACRRIWKTRDLEALLKDFF